MVPYTIVTYIHGFIPWYEWNDFVHQYKVPLRDVGGVNPGGVAS